MRKVKLFVSSMFASALAALLVSVPVDAQSQVAPNTSDEGHKSILDEVVVTGTLISGGEPASQVAAYSREDIQLQGYGDVQDFIQSLPQNFSGGGSESTVGAGSGGGSTLNNTAATGINLRGLGNSSTLVLLDGHRIAAGNTIGNIVDISMLPLAAMERVDVMADGASAIYGSDAVGGVVNFVLRHHFDGQESSVRYGQVTEGSRDETIASQVLGRDWGSGSALVVYAFDHATALDARDRPYLTGLSEPYDILPDRRVNNLVLTGQQQLGHEVELYGNATFSNRYEFTDFNSFGTYHEPSSTTAYSASGGLRAQLTDTLTLDISPSYTYSRAHFAPHPATAEVAVFSNMLEHSSDFSVDAKVSGTALQGWAGDIRFAAGGQFRHEAFSFVDTLRASTAFGVGRNVSAGFAEVHVPLIAARSGDGAASPLVLEVADRQEHYSDFGSTNNPRVGLVWKPLSALTWNLTYSTSYVAPLLDYMNPVPYEVVAVPGNFAGGVQGPGAPDSIFELGGNPNLTAEKSRNLSLGVKFAPPRWGLQAYADYYRIDFTDRIENLTSEFDIFSAFQNAAALGPLVQFHAPAAAIQALVAEPTFLNLGVQNLSTITAIVDVRQHNLSTVKTSGLDFGLSQRFTPTVADVELGVDGTYILNYDTQFTATSPVVSYLNRVFNPVNLRLRTRSVVQRGPWSVSAFLNYVNSYRNVVNGEFARVASWETIDMNARYQLQRPLAFIREGSIAVGVTNLANRAPPYVLNLSAPGLNFDGANANNLGRFVFVELSARW